MLPKKDFYESATHLNIGASSLITSLLELHRSRIASGEDATKVTEAVYLHIEFYPYQLK